MKEIILIIALTAGVFFSLRAGDDKSKQAVVELLQQLDTASTVAEYLNLANAFERVSQFDSKSWYPVYYASFCYIMATFKEKDKATADLYADKAIKLGERADKLQPENSEINTLLGYSSQAKLSVYPMERSQTMAARSNKYFEKAKVLDPRNPRPYFLQSQNLYHTPAAFGGGKDVACPLAQKAAALFDSGRKDERDPTWGRKANELFLQKCQ